MTASDSKKSGRMSRSKSGPELTLCARLRDERQRLHFSIRELGERSGVAERTIQSYEAGRSLPGAGELRKLSMALNVSVDYLVFGSELKGPQGSPQDDYFDGATHDDEYIARVGAALLALSEGERAAVHQILTSMLLGHMGRERFERLKIVASNWWTRITVDAEFEPMPQVYMTPEGRKKLAAELGLTDESQLDAEYRNEPRAKTVRESAQELSGGGEPGSSEK